MSQKILQIGSSLGVTLGQDVLGRAGLKRGDRVSVEYDRKNGSIVVRPLTETAQVEVITSTRDLIAANRKELDKLSDEP